MMKKILAFLCVAFIILNIFVFADGAQDMTEYLYYVIEDGEVTITGCKDRDLEGDFYIPEKIENCPVTRIGDSAFSVCTEITSITLPDTVKSIGAGAFVKCAELQEIYLGNSLEFIGEEAFWCCFSLTSVNFPASLTKIEVGRSVFYECTALEKIEIDENNPVYYSQNNCLIERETKTLVAGCKTSIIPQDIVTIGVGAFNSALSMKNIEIPESVKSIEERAFLGCNSLEKIFIPKSVTEIADIVFSRCYGLKSITVDENNPVYYMENNCLKEKATGKVIFEIESEPTPSPTVAPTPIITEEPAPTPTETQMPKSFVSAGEGRYSSIAIMTVVTILAMIFVVIFAFKERNKK